VLACWFATDHDQAFLEPKYFLPEREVLSLCLDLFLLQLEIGLLQTVHFALQFGVLFS